MTQVVSEMVLHAAWSLDLTTVDPEDGISLEAKRKDVAWTF